MTDDEVNDLLYSIPEEMDEDEIIQEVELKYIPTERIDKLIFIIENDKLFKFRQVYSAACLLCYWGFDYGLNYVSKILMDTSFKLIRESCLDDGDYKYILGGIEFYYLRKLDLDEFFYLKRLNFYSAKLAREKIYPCVEIVFEYAKDNNFDICFFYNFIINNELYEYVGLIKEYFLSIIKKPKENYIDVCDAINFLLRFCPDYVMDILYKNKLSINDFDLSKSFLFWKDEY